MLPARGLKCFPSSGPDPFRDDANDSACIVSSGCKTAGNVTQFTLKNVNIDDYVFGVSAIGADGQESLVSAYVSPVRRDTPFKRVK